jgi:hypothetical protein
MRDKTVAGYWDNRTSCTAEFHGSWFGFQTKKKQLTFSFL